jgi:hypothetical protein
LCLAVVLAILVFRLVATFTAPLITAFSLLALLALLLATCLLTPTLLCRFTALRGFATLLASLLGFTFFGLARAEQGSP